MASWRAMSARPENATAKKPPAEAASVKTTTAANAGAEDSAAAEAARKTKVRSTATMATSADAKLNSNACASVNPATRRTP